jgi:hypothetical protein
LLGELDPTIAKLSPAIEQDVEKCPTVQHLMTYPGVGPLTALAKLLSTQMGPSDYFTRTAISKSNILVNKPNETKYFYQDLDGKGARLNGRNRYTVTFAAGQIPP